MGRKILEAGDYRVKQYRPRIEGGFARIEKIQSPQHGIYWKVTAGNNIATIYGRSEQARIADPSDPSRVFEWLPEFSYDDKGNWIQYVYKSENLENVGNAVHERNRLNGLAPFTDRYLKRVLYGNKRPYYVSPEQPYDPQAPGDPEYFFELVFDFGEHDPERPLPSRIHVLGLPPGRLFHVPRRI